MENESSGTRKPILLQYRYHKTKHVTDNVGKVLAEYEVTPKCRYRTTFNWKYWTDGKGTYYCAACGNKLFRLSQILSSRGWPSFFEQENKNSIYKDNPVACNEPKRLGCDGHLGHLLTICPVLQERYRMNLLALFWLYPLTTNSIKSALIYVSTALKRRARNAKAFQWYENSNT
jgi:peptide methionine sulfoxide reductase MsrB